MSVNDHPLSWKTGKAAQLPVIENALVQWIDSVNSSEILITGLMVQKQAKQIAQQLQIPVEHFAFSSGWLWQLQKRYKARSLPDHGEAGSCNPEQVVKGRRECQDIILGYEKRDVYNLDETALNYCAHRRRSLCRRGIKRVLATNADGSEKIPLYFIGTAMKPKCFGGKAASHYGL